MPINADVLRPYANNQIFVETGTHNGDGVQAAVDCRFPSIWSVDLNESDVVKKRFEHSLRVTLCTGTDSRRFLSNFLTGIKTPCTFWLDAHACGGAGSYADVPLLEELEIIASHPIKSHTILIDDMRIIGSQHLRLDRSEENISMWKLLEAINKINPRYLVRLIHSNQFNFDIMACIPWPTREDHLAALTCTAS